MRVMKWVGYLFVLVLIYAAFLPWATIESKQLTITGMNTTGTNWGVPANLHFVFIGIYVIFSLLPFISVKRMNILITVINLAWAMRNFIMLARCEGGECPVRRIGLYLILLSSIIIFITTLFPDIKLKPEDNPEGIS
ncbi:MAG TPA: hypothetical protein VIQ00_13465 [Chitinophagaceae bacterium]|jgi:hypothetical protein